jgi:hypothetical protein
MSRQCRMLHPTRSPTTKPTAAWIPKAAAAKLLNVSTRQIERRQRDGAIQKQTTATGQVLYSRADVEALKAGSPRAHPRVVDAKQPAALAITRPAADPMAALAQPGDGRDTLTPAAAQQWKPTSPDRQEARSHTTEEFHRQSATTPCQPQCTIRRTAASPTHKPPEFQQPGEPHPARHARPSTWPNRHLRTRTNAVARHQRHITFAYRPVENRAEINPWTQASATGYDAQNDGTLDNQLL